MFRNVLITGFLAMFSLMTLAAEDVLYKWKDAEGNIKFGDRPPKGVPFERIKVRRSKSTGSASAITEKLDAKKQDNSDVEEQLSKAQQQMAEACKIAKANMSTLNNASRIKVAVEGGTRLMTEEEKEAKKKETQRQIDEYCNSQSESQ
ncbi:DUF4124 domain-containing protein [Pleionea mediterranea]|uniref:Uncharacterized protein DUF4124 n=1 Tax=Pleionea mediterranea TaxID=523701 RepID=A0A316FCW7_9GAMM|nr:DUF4124 domain-containing protein [Pleionea mediterranea]PWK44451.1 uncharacterized protein DUF4124 [Pleionea mediterranea]